MVIYLVYRCLLSIFDKSFYLGVYVDYIFVIGNDEDIFKNYEYLGSKLILNI